jgi:hypothetical protein
MSVIIDIADAVVSALNGHTFSHPFQAERQYVPTFDLEEMDGLYVTVVPRGVEMSTANRALQQSDVQIDVIVQQKMPVKKSEHQAFLDERMDLVQGIADFIRATGRFADSLWVKTESMPLFVPDHIDQFHQFISVLTLTLRDMRA